jgi:hypothetical protein
VIVNLRIEFHSCDEYLLAVGRRRQFTMEAVLFMDDLQYDS